MGDDKFQLIYLAGFLLGSVIRKIYTGGYRQRVFTDVRRQWLDTTLLAVAAIGFIVLPMIYLLTDWLAFADYGMPPLPGEIAGWAGALVFTSAVWLLWRSHVDLGENWSPVLKVREGHSLVTRGVYGRLRHPMYAAHFLWGAGQALLLQNWLAGCGFLVAMLPLYLLRAPREEQMMIDHFGDQYRRYRQRTGRLLPKFGWRCCGRG